MNLVQSYLLHYGASHLVLSLPLPIFGWFVHAPHAVEKGMPLFVGMFQVMIATGSLLGGYVVDHFNENTLIYGVLSFVALALISTFTFAKGLNNPKVTCEN